MPRVNNTTWIIASTIVIAILVVGGGFIWANSSKKSARIVISGNQKSAEIKKGQEFSISLPSNPSTGYGWSVDDTYNKNIVTKLSNEFEPSSTKMIGAPGEELWVFKGMGEGNTKLNFKYTRQRGGDTSQLDLKTFDITVK